MPSYTPEQFAKLGGVSVSSIQTNSTQTQAPVFQPEKKGFLQDITEIVNKIFPGKQVGESIGTLAALGIEKLKGEMGGKDNSQFLDLSAPTPFQTASDVASGALTIASTGLGGTGSFASRVGTEAAIGAGLGGTNSAANGGSLGDIAESTAIGGAIGGAIPAVGAGISKIASSAANTAEKIASSPYLKGATQLGKDTIQKAPRFTSRLKGDILESAAKADRLQSATPEVANAIKNGVDDNLLTHIESIDRTVPQGQATVKGYKDMVDIAENAKTKIGTPDRPEIVAGKAVEDQFKIVESQRKAIGKKIGAKVDELSKHVAVPMQESFDTLKAVLKENGVSIGKAGEIGFNGAKYTSKERAGITELWKEATRTGETLTPRQVYDADKLFSKLQREARLDGIGDLFVKTPDGDMPLFSVFRDVFSNKLDAVAPKIKGLNSEYRNLAQLKSDLEDSIIKSGNFNITKGMDTSKFAQTNLRRLTSDAQSAAVYREITDKLDTVARKFGYEGASASQLNDFAQELRKIYKKVPSTSATGVLDNGIGGAVGKLLKAGGVSSEDTQMALKLLLDSLQ